MASVSLYRDEAEDGDLPRLCICCGDPEAEFEERRFFWQPWYVNHPLWAGVFRRYASASLPFCDHHAGGIGSRGSWFSKGPSLWGLRPTHITEEVINLAGVSEEFVEALERHRDGERVERPRRRTRRAEDDREEQPRTLARRSEGRRRPPAPSGNGALVVVLIVLGVVLGLPVLGCGGLMVLSLVLPKPAPPAFAPVQPAWPPMNPQPAVVPAGNLRPEDAVGMLAVAPEGCPAALPWTALARLSKPDLPRSPTDAEIAKALDDLRSNHPTRARSAAEQLAKQPPVENHRKNVSDALMKLTNEHSVFTRQAAYRALVVWGKPDDVPGLVTALEGEQHPGSRAAIIDALAALKDARAAEPLAKRLSDHFDRDHAAKALIAVGPAAEEAVRPVLKHRDVQGRIKACEVLGAVGTAASAEDLEAAAKDANRTVAQAAQKALEAVKARP